MIMCHETCHRTRVLSLICSQHWPNYQKIPLRPVSLAQRVFADVCTCRPVLDETEIISAVPLPSALATYRCRPEERRVDGRVLFRVREIWRLLMMIVAAKRRETYDIARRTSLMKQATSIATHRSQYPIFTICHKKSRSYSHTTEESDVLHHAYASCFAGKYLTAVGFTTDACILCEKTRILLRIGT